MSTPSDGFGRRGSNDGHGRFRSEGPTPTGRRSGTPRLMKQIGGILFGVALVVGLDQLSQAMMRQVGRNLDAAFVETARQGDPRTAIGRMDTVDPELARADKRCRVAYDGAKLSKRQRDASRMSLALMSGEAEIARSAAYLACLTRFEPQRLCDKAHKDHLISAVGEYFKLDRQLGEQWQIEASFAGRPPGYMPSVRTSPDMLDGIAALVAAGYVKPGDFGGIGGIGVPSEIRRATEGIEPKKADCP